MKIAHISTAWSPYNYKQVYGVRKMISMLVRAQAELGHEVFILAPNGSEAEYAKIIETSEPLTHFGLWLYDPKSMMYELIHGAEATRICNEQDFDVVHSHAEDVMLPFAELINKPFLSTIHGTRFNDAEHHILKKYYGKSYIVAISNKIREVNSFIKYSAVVYNGITMEPYTLNLETNQKAMFWIGRIHPDKGATEAIEIAESLNKELVMFGQKDKEEYGKELAERAAKTPNIKLSTDYLDDEQKNDILRESKLLLFPLQWEEPFGMTMVESMATGTPVVAFAKGAVPEVLVDGKTGFIVNFSEEDKRGDWIIKKTGIEGIKEAVEKIYTMPDTEYKKMRQNCRDHAESNFSAITMAKNYEKLYTELINNRT